MLNLPDAFYIGFGKKFIESFFSQGFGTLPKSEIDYLVFKLLVENTNLKDENKFNLSLLLRTTPAKIKSLKYRLMLEQVTSSNDELH